MSPRPDPRRGLLLPLLLLAAGCRGGISDKPPIHPVLDMDFQPKLKAQSKSEFEGWADRRGMRMPVAGTIARGALDRPELTTFRNPDGSYLARNPIPVSLEVLERGRERYDVFCSVCHDRTGSGKGLVGKRWPVPIPSFLDHERVSKLGDAEIFDVVTNGRSTMPAYGPLIPPADRWQIIHYIRALQERVR
jgi:mono/diheme cytochrome c family protein